MSAHTECLNGQTGAGAGMDGRGQRSAAHLGRAQAANRYQLDVSPVTAFWGRGRVIASRLLDITATAVDADDPDLAAVSGRGCGFSEERRTAPAAIDVGVPTPAISGAQYSRFDRHGDVVYAGRALAVIGEQLDRHNKKQRRR